MSLICINDTLQLALDVATKRNPRGPRSLGVQLTTARGIMFLLVMVPSAEWKDRSHRWSSLMELVPGGHFRAGRVCGGGGNRTLYGAAQSSQVMRWRPWHRPLVWPPWGRASAVESPLDTTPGLAVSSCPNRSAESRGHPQARGSL